MASGKIDFQEAKLLVRGYGKVNLQHFLSYDNKISNLLKLNRSPLFTQQSPLVRPKNWRNSDKIAHSPRILESRIFIVFHQTSEAFVKRNIILSIIRKLHL
jgi:hypothetical protein